MVKLFDRRKCIIVFFILCDCDIFIYVLLKLYLRKGYYYGIINFSF